LPFAPPKIHESSLVWIEDGFFTFYKPTYKMLQHGIFGLIFNFGFVVNTIKTVSQV
jgi:hypothetical protein